MRLKTGSTTNPVHRNRSQFGDWLTFFREKVKIRQIAQTIHSLLCRENCPCPPHFAVNGDMCAGSHVGREKSG